MAASLCPEGFRDFERQNTRRDFPKIRINWFKLFRKIEKFEKAADRVACPCDAPYSVRIVAILAAGGGVDGQDVYQFKPHERPTLPGSPANPDHPRGGAWVISRSAC
jgi:hypothetical protein